MKRLDINWRNAWAYWIVPINLIIAFSTAWLILLEQGRKPLQLSTLITTCIPVVLIIFLWYFVFSATKHSLKQLRANSSSEPIDNRQAIALILVYVGLIIVTHTLPNFVSQLINYNSLSDRAIQYMVYTSPQRLILINAFFVKSFLALLLGFWLVFRSSKLINLRRYRRTSIYQNIDLRKGLRLMVWVALLFFLNNFKSINFGGSFMSVVNTMIVLFLLWLWFLVIVSIYKIFPSSTENNTLSGLDAGKVLSVSYIVVGLTSLSFTAPNLVQMIATLYGMFYFGSFHPYQIILLCGFFLELLFSLWLIFRLGRIWGLYQYSKTDTTRQSDQSDWG
ncbi:hypothetical protein MNBD_GAMMA12-1996 [hydrothermal vent metagenome]|uniref:Uncharacterized protein n=1 Tax=hydrothermal vent metagenome TaxID=652676 RepID=A0A3B0YYQ5_9ZZZZ